MLTRSRLLTCYSVGMQACCTVQLTESESSQRQSVVSIDQLHILAIMKLELSRLMKLDRRNEGKAVSFLNFTISKVLQRR